MTSLLSRLNGTKTSVPIEPRDIFMLNLETYLCRCPKRIKGMSILEMFNLMFGNTGFNQGIKKLCHKNEYWKWKNRSRIDDLAKLPE